eukprot:CAMPEP_0113900730 /NCGR_PEP_ID=MMETSP0780_2-20120614/20847_1 /TAXON_ID=652834 /ORGANISM="Palpitomonas bilix" /LENGTH=884 /DNA_ID=CAMNT_0000893237 /DNA_START=478 /DNA_END=3132 /DNA_ORIENTATION=- /assembly_acc=CAM_ASM_000599
MPFQKQHWKGEGGTASRSKEGFLSFAVSLFRPLHTSKEASWGTTDADTPVNTFGITPPVRVDIDTSVEGFCTIALAKQVIARRFGLPRVGRIFAADGSGIEIKSFNSLKEGHRYIAEDNRGSDFVRDFLSKQRGENALRFYPKELEFALPDHISSIDEAGVYVEHMSRTVRLDPHDITEFEQHEILGDDATSRGVALLKECFFVPNGKEAKEGKWLSFNFGEAKPLQLLLAFLESSFRFREGSIQKLRSVDGTNIKEMKDIQSGEAYIMCGVEAVRYLSSSEVLSMPSQQMDLLANAASSTRDAFTKAGGSLPFDREEVSGVYDDSDIPFSHLSPSVQRQRKRMGLDESVVESEGQTTAARLPTSSRSAVGGEVTEQKSARDLLLDSIRGYKQEKKIEKFGVQASKAKIIYVIRNGDKHDAGTKFVVNEKRYPTLDKLKTALSPLVGLPTGPIQKFFDLEGTPITSLGKFVDRGYVIACGGEKPVLNIYYRVQQQLDLAGSTTDRSFHQHVRGKHYSEDTASSSFYSSSIGIGTSVKEERYVNHPTEFASSLRSSRKPIDTLNPFWKVDEEEQRKNKDVKHAIQKYGVQAEKAKTVFIFKNGDRYDLGRTYVINEKRTPTLEKLMKALSADVKLPTGPIFKICTMDGRIVKTLSSFQDGGSYIACGGEKVVTSVYADNIRNDILKEVRQHNQGEGEGGGGYRQGVEEEYAESVGESEDLPPALPDRPLHFTHEHEEPEDEGRGMTMADLHLTPARGALSPSPSPSPMHGAPKGGSAIKKYGVQVEKAKVLYVYRNGDYRSCGIRFALNKRMYPTMDKLLRKLSTEVGLPTGPVKKLCRLDGRVVLNIEDFKDGEDLVACAAEKYDRESGEEAVRRWKPHLTMKL